VVVPSPAATFPYGSQTFAEIYRPAVFYSDKTRFIRQIEALGTAARAVLALFPRRFGKSVFLETVGEYYDVRNKRSFKTLFGGTDVGKNPTDLQSRFMVLRLDFSGIRAASFEDFNDKFSENLVDAIGRFCTKYNFKVPEARDGVALFEKLWSAVLAQQQADPTKPGVRRSPYTIGLADSSPIAAVRAGGRVRQLCDEGCRDHGQTAERIGNGVSTSSQRVLYVLEQSQSCARLVSRLSRVGHRHRTSVYDRVCGQRRKYLRGNLFATTICRPVRAHWRRG
jgi:hypothetical protein